MVTILFIALGIPLIVVIGNGIVRWVFGLPQSAAADMILAVVVFDAAVALQAHDFQPYVKVPLFKSNLAVIYESLLIINMFVWMTAVLKLEPRLLSEFDFKRQQYDGNPSTLIFYSYLLSVFVLLTNTVVFTAGG